MDFKSKVPEPFQFNPLKHHFMFIREFVSDELGRELKSDSKVLIKELKRIGSSVMDVYAGVMTIEDICTEISEFLGKNDLCGFKEYSEWTGIHFSSFRSITLSDSSEWMLKFHRDENRYVHIFPSRMSPHSFRIKANTLKSAILYYIIIGKDYISGNDLNYARSLLDLPPVKETIEAEAITEMIEKLRA